MREPLKDRIRLEHIVEAINKVYKYTEGKTCDDLRTTDMMFYAVVKNIEIVGEAAYHLTKAYCRSHPETDWEGIKKLRHVLVHDYYQINVQTVWDIIQQELPPLLDQVTRYITETDWEEWEKSYKVVTETAVHKNLIQTASRMKKDGMDTKQISRYTGLTAEEIEEI
jgi:uncharacterized protein with HEPN domain